MSIRMSPNSREVIGAISTITNKQEYLTSTNGALNINGSFSLSGQAIPASGLTTAVAVQIVDGSGNQISSFGGGTQYNDNDSVPPTATGPTLMWDDSGDWIHVGLNNPLPVQAPGGLVPEYADGDNPNPAIGIVSLGQNASDVVHPLQLDPSGNLLVNIATGGGSGGTSSSFASAFPSTGTAIGATDGTNMQPLKVDGSDNLLTKINAALPSGTNVIGHVITDTGSTTAVTGTVTISGTVTANAGTNLNTSLLALESGGNLATLAGAVTSSVVQTNEKQINGVVPLMGNGVTGTGSQRVTIASDNTAFSVNATLSAETTKVIGTVNQGTSPWIVSLTSTTITGTVTVAGGKTNNTAAPGATNIGALTTLANASAPTWTEGDMVTASSDLAGNTRVILNAETTKVIGVTRTADGSGNLLTSTANALDINIKSGSIANTSFAVTQGTAANLNATVVGTGTFAVQNTAATPAGTNLIGKVGIDQTTVGTTNAVSIAQIGANTVLTGNGTAGTGAQRVTIASDNTAFSVNATLSAETTKVIGTVNQGTSPWVVNDPGLPDTLGQKTESGSTSVVIASDQSAIPVSLSPGGNAWKTFFANTITTTQTVSGSAGEFGGYALINTNSTPAYLQFFDTTGAVTLGSTTPTFVIPLPANSTPANGVGANFELGAGSALANGLKVAATTTPTGASTVATGISGTIWYF